MASNRSLNAAVCSHAHIDLTGQVPGVYAVQWLDNNGRTLAVSKMILQK
jgi:predicted metal-dependent RNase